MPTFSETIKAELCRHPVGYTFTSADIQVATSIPSHGAISGFLANCKERGLIESVRNGRVATYRIIRPIDSYQTKSNGNFNGSTSGRTIVRKSKLSWKERFLALAVEVERALEAPRSIRDFSTAELIRELGRREKVK